MKTWKPLLLLIASTLGTSLNAEAKCSIRVGDPLITVRYQQCNQRTFLSYLYNDLVTPYSFTCAKRLSETCRKENCDDPKTEEEKTRCMGHYVAVLDECSRQIDDAARMANCTDTKVWPIPTLATRGTGRSPRINRIIPGPAMVVPDAPLEIPVITVEPLPPEAFQIERKATRTSQSSRKH